MKNSPLKKLKGSIAKFTNHSQKLKERLQPLRPQTQMADGGRQQDQQY
jgi:hypothetical protein